MSNYTNREVNLGTTIRIASVELEKLQLIRKQLEDSGLWQEAEPLIISAKSEQHTGRIRLLATVENQEKLYQILASGLGVKFKKTTELPLDDKQSFIYDGIWKRHLGAAGDIRIVVASA